jgi:SAM-dependent methyltransferase
MSGIRADINPRVRPNVILDLSAPLPFCNDAFDAIYGFSILEHLPNTFDALAEMHRVVRPGGFLALLVPHFASASAHTDPTHQRFFSASSFDYVVPGTRLFAQFGFYETYSFRYRTRLLMLDTPWTHLPYLQQWVNRHSNLYDRHLCYVLRPTGIYVELEVS